MTRSMFWFLLFSSLLTVFISIAANPRFGWDLESTTSSTALSWLRSSSSSSSTPKFKYDVFLSFRGDDTRNSFTSHLRKALDDKQIETFTDDKLERGDEISPSLLKAIEESRISVVIFSKDYASSRWCLEELVKILECSKKYNQIVMPVFYGVDPTHISDQTGDFADAFADHEQRFKDVLGQAANFSGWNSENIKPESALIEKIVEDILKRLKVYRSSHDRNLVGIYSRIKHIVESFFFSNVDFLVFFYFLMLLFFFFFRES